jgi:hypothetical protein
MFLFHGTRGARETVRSIAREGLRAHPHRWTHGVLDDEAPTVFVSPTPVAGHGGDPVAFAMGFARHKGPRAPGDGWIIVFDVATEEPDALSFVKAVVANRDIDQHFFGQSALSLMLAPLSTQPNAPLVIEVLYELAQRDDLHRIARELEPTLVSLAPGVSMPEPSFARWRAYCDAIVRARSSDEVERAGRRYGVERESPFVPHCELCVETLADWAYALPSHVKLACTGGERALLLARYGRRDLFGQGLEQHARMVGRWYEAADRSEIEQGFRRLRERRREQPPPIERLRAGTPIDLSRVPDAWTPRFGRTHTLEDARARDVQLVCDAIDPRHMIGAIHLASGPRFRPWARPTRDDRLPSKLWRAARWLRAHSARADTIYDG